MTRPKPRGKPWAPCPNCRQKCRVANQWMCADCEADALVIALAAIASRICNLATERRTCPVDGCLLRRNEICPACRVRDNKIPATTARPGAAPPPPGWVRKGGILVRKKAA